MTQFLQHFPTNFISFLSSFTKNFVVVAFAFDGKIISHTIIEVFCHNDVIASSVQVFIHCSKMFIIIEKRRRASRKKMIPLLSFVCALCTQSFGNVWSMCFDVWSWMDELNYCRFKFRLWALLIKSTVLLWFDLEDSCTTIYYNAIRYAYKII